MSGPAGGSALVRRARLVPVGGGPAPRDPVDVRIRDGLVVDVAPELRPGLEDEHVVDADGRWAVPGLWDAHVHLLQAAQARSRLDVSGTHAPEEVVRIVAAHVAALPDDRAGAAVLGLGYRSATWPRQPTVAELDAVSGGRPVALVSGDAHNGWLNSRALELLGLPPRTTALDEDAWFPVLPRLVELPGADAAATDAAYREVVRDAAALGVVGVVDLELGRGFADWPDRVARGIDSLRVRPATYPSTLDEVLAARLRTGDPLPGGAGLLTMGPLKIHSDGSLGTGTAHCHEPYACAADGSPRGKQTVPPDELQDLLRRATGHGLEAAVHAIGDAAVGIALDAFAATGATGSVEHAQLMTRDDVQRMGRLGVRASVQPAHLLDDRDPTERCWADRADRCFPFRSLLDAGVVLALGSDVPVAPLDPWLAMAAAVHRSADDRPPWNPAEHLTAAEVLAASTDGRTTVAVGSPGDLVLLDDDPLQPVAAGSDTAATAATARHLRTVRVAATLLGGRPTHLAW